MFTTRIMQTTTTSSILKKLHSSTMTKKIQPINKNNIFEKNHSIPPIMNELENMYMCSNNNDVFLRQISLEVITIEKVFALMEEINPEIHQQYQNCDNFKKIFDPYNGIDAFKRKIYARIESLQKDRFKNYKNNSREENLSLLQYCIQQRSRHQADSSHFIEYDHIIRKIRKILYPDIAVIVIPCHALVKPMIENAASEGNETVLICSNRDKNKYLSAVKLADRVLYVEDENNVKEITRALISFKQTLDADYSMIFKPGDYYPENLELIQACEDNNISYAAPVTSSRQEIEDQIPTRSYFCGVG